MGWVCRCLGTQPWGKCLLVYYRSYYWGGMTNLNISKSQMYNHSTKLNAVGSPPTPVAYTDLTDLDLPWPRLTRPPPPFPV